jgi:hypothetical protein
MYYLNTKFVILIVYHTSINIDDSTHQKFKKYREKHPVNLSDTINRALEIYLTQQLKTE